MQFIILVAFSVAVFNGMNAQLAGGLTDVNPSDYTKSAWKSVPQINNENDGDNYLVPVKVVKAQVQVVAGTNTVLEVLVAESTCSKGLQATQVTSDKCQLKSGGQRSLYKVSIWEKPWENFEQITAEKIRDVSADEKF
uniref:Cystatin domain-containing protein n=2 Tax=Caenorhabditis tropicalis TaxID=1561998 RepID=A0A1I7UM44_9PELO